QLVGFFLDFFLFARVEPTSRKFNGLAAHHPDSAFVKEPFFWIDREPPIEKPLWNQAAIDPRKAQAPSWNAGNARLNGAFANPSSAVIVPEAQEIILLEATFRHRMIDNGSRFIPELFAANEK